MSQKNLKIVVIYGGISSEREVSLRSGKAVYDALVGAGYTDVTLFDLTRQSISQLANTPMDVAYLALHGKGGEDGCVQGLLELMGVAYTGPCVEASANCINKIRTKELLVAAGLPTPRFLKLSRDDSADREKVVEQIEKVLGLPVVIKSPYEGSSIGVYIAKSREHLSLCVDETFKLGEYLLAEEYVDGVELTLPILGNNDLTVLPAVEITSENEFYDFDSKYTAGKCHHIIPARISDEALSRVNDIGKKAYKFLGCTGLSRIDMILDKTKGPMIIEVNTLPGMTEMSLFPDSARYVGISFSELVERIIDYAIESHKEKIK